MDHRGTKTARRLIARFAALAALLLPVSPGQASGQLPPVPVAPRSFADFEACLAHLETTHRADLDGVEAGAVRTDENTTRRKVVESRGALRIGPASARYEARVGVEIRFANHEKGFIETTFSYEDTRLECRGGELSGTVTRGYMLPGMERM